jgi:hypothetical protein
MYTKEGSIEMKEAVSLQIWITLPLKAMESSSASSRCLTLKNMKISMQKSISTKFYNDNIRKRMRWAGHVAHMREDRGVHRVLVGRLEGKRLLGRPRRRWEDNIKMDLQEVGEGREDWMELAQDRDRYPALVGTVRDFRVP